jgi:DNA-binding MarR family transcriptional regulator
MTQQDVIDFMKKHKQKHLFNSKQIAAGLGVSSSTATTLLARLTRDGCCERIRSFNNVERRWVYNYRLLRFKDADN